MMGVLAALEESLTPGTAITRYDRTWRLGQWSSQQDGRVIVSRIGFESTDSATEIWDEGRRDFVVNHPRLGQTSQFAINRASLKVAFQLRGQTIKPQTFRGNLVALLRESTGYKWKFDLDGVEQASWDDWVGSVLRVTKLHVSMLIPNPRYNDDRIEELFEETKSAAVDLVLNAGEEGIDIEASDFVVHSIEHAIRYGSYDAVGIVVQDGIEEKETWKSSLEGEVVKTSVPQNAETREIDPRLLATIVDPLDAGAEAEVTDEE